MKKLDKLNVRFGSILPPPTPGARSAPFILPITLLSLASVYVLSPLDSSSLPLLRSLHLYDQTHQPIRLLLPKIASLHVKDMHSDAHLDFLIQESTSITSLSTHEKDILTVNEASRTAIRERVVELRLQVLNYGQSSGIALAAIIDGSKAMKKVFLDGGDLCFVLKGEARFLEILQLLTAACKKKKIELWKENFLESGNGKVDLEK
jgi:hypothetical protein